MKDLIYLHQLTRKLQGFEHQGYFALIDKKGYIRSRRDNFGNPIVYYNGIDKSNSYDGTENLIYDIEKLLNE